MLAAKKSPKRARKSKFEKIYEDITSKYDNKNYHVLVRSRTGNLNYLFGMGKVPQIGRWQVRKGPLEMCRSGSLHYCKMYQVSHWFDYVTHELYEVEVDGPSVHVDDKSACLKRKRTKYIGKLTNDTYSAYTDFLHCLNIRSTNIKELTVPDDAIIKFYVNYVRHLYKFYFYLTEIGPHKLQHNEALSVILFYIIEQPFEIFCNKK